MQIISKKGDEMYILFKPRDNLRVGDCLRIENILVQIIDVEYANLPGIMEHVLRKSMLSERTEEEMQERVKGFLDTLSDHKMATTKIRGTVEGGSFSQGFEELKVNRSNAEIERVSANELLTDILALSSSYQETIGQILFEEPEDFNFLLDELGINLITGMKGSGKSYLAKRLLLRLIDHGKVTIVFDINGEYLKLWRKADGEPSKYYKRIEVLNPLIRVSEGRSSPLRIPLYEVDYDEFANMLNINPETNMYNVLIQFWNSRDRFDLDDFEDWLERNPVNMHDATQQGLLGKVRTARSMGLFGPCDFKGKIERLEESGGALIVNLRGENRPRREMIVRHIMSRLTKLRKDKEIKPISVFTEEAQLYVTRSLWDDILTRMRHYGIFPTFITNDPRTLPDEVYSLCDNLVSFSFHNPDDLKQLSKAKMIDLDTLKLLQNIEFQSALMIGKITNEFPVVVSIYPEDGVMMGGETEELF